MELDVRLIITHKIIVEGVALLVALLMLFPVLPSLAATSAEVQEWLQAHNNYRALHGVPAVTWSNTVAASAQAYADTCPESHSGGQYGENMAWASYDLGESGAVKLWYDEEPLYDYGKPGFSDETGHFTQVVWKSTIEIGCGYATNCNISGMNYVWVCQYNPHGNVIGQFANNVFPPVAPDVTVLTNGVALHNLAGTENQKNYYSLDVPDETGTLTVQTYGGSGDADLFVKHGVLPGISYYDCKSLNDGNIEECQIDSPAAGTWYIMVAGYLAYDNVTLLGSYRKANTTTTVIPPILFLLK